MQAKRIAAACRVEEVLGRTGRDEVPGAGELGVEVSLDMLDSPLSATILWGRDSRRLCPRITEVLPAQVQKEEGPQSEERERLDLEVRRAEGEHLPLVLEPRVVRWGGDRRTRIYHVDDTEETRHVVWRPGEWDERQMVLAAGILQS